MIRTKKRRAAPPSLSRACVKRHRRELAAIAKTRKIKSKEFTRYWGESDVKDALDDMHHRGKCCYCERRRDKSGETAVEHFRPKAEVAESGAHPGYWWLAYEWENYLLSCGTCNGTHKGTHFPLLNEATRSTGPADDVANERPVLIDPSTEDPEEFFVYEWVHGGGLLVNVFGVDDEGRGEATRKILGLNRQELSEERAEPLEDMRTLERLMQRWLQLKREAFRESEVKKIQDHIDREGKMIAEATSSRRAFAGFRRAFFKAAGLGDYVADD